MAKYFPEPPPFPERGSQESRELLEYVYRELNRISVSLFTEVYLNLEKTFVVPARPQDGDVVYADGTSWNPGSGQGVYRFNGTVWIKLDNDGIMLGSGGLQWPATEIPNSDPNNMYDYERGLWTPTFLSSPAFTSITYDALTHGTYMKIGSMVFVRGTIQTDAVNKGAAAGNVTIGGLPFSAATVVAAGQAGWVGFSSGFLAGHPSSVLPFSSGLFMIQRAVANGASSFITVADIAVGADANTVSFGAMYNSATI